MVRVQALELTRNASLGWNLLLCRQQCEDRSHWRLRCRTGHGYLAKSLDHEAVVVFADNGGQGGAIHRSYSPCSK